MKQMPVLSFLSWFDESQSAGDVAHVALVELAEREHRSRELALIEAIQEVALVLGAVLGLEQLHEAVDLPHLRVVAGGDPFGTQRQRMVEKGLELDLGVAEHVGIGRAPRLVLGQEVREHAFLVLGGEVHRLDLDAEALGDGHGIHEVLPRRAVLVGVVVLPVLHEEADDLEALFLEQPGGHRRVDPARHADDHLAFTHRVGGLGELTRDGSRGRGNSVGPRGSRRCSAGRADCGAGARQGRSPQE